MEFKNTIKTALPLATVVLCLGFGVNQAQAAALYLYSDIPTVDVHLGHENTSFAGAPANSGITSFGSLIRPETGYLYYVTAALSNYATAAQYAGFGNATGYDVSLTLDLYNPGLGTGTSPDRTFALGSLIASSSTVANIAWRPSGNTAQTCGGTNENAYQTGGASGPQSCGQLNMVNFDFGSNPLLNGDVIWQLTINGKTTGPAQSLNWALSDGTYTAVEGDTGNFTSTSNPQYGTNYLNGVGTLGYGAISTWSQAGQGEIALFGTPEPATFGLIGLGLVGLGFAARRKTKV